MSTEHRSGSINDPSIHRTLLVPAGLLVASFAAGAVLTFGLTTGRLLVREDAGAAGAAVTETTSSQSGGLTAEQRAVDFRLSEKELPTRSELTAEQRAVDFRLSEKGLPTQFEPTDDMSAAAYAATHDGAIGAAAPDDLDMSSAVYGAIHPTGTDMDSAAYAAMHQH